MQHTSHFPTLDDATRPQDGFWLRIIGIVSVLVCLAVGFLLLGPRPEGTAGQLDVSALPAVNATLNSITTVLLLAGFVAIRRGNITTHRRLMLSAFASSTLFLITYVLYHWFQSGPRPYMGAWKGLYVTLLLSHIVLAAIIIPLALVTLYRGFHMQRRTHRRIARITLPLWLYVSVTGVIIYGMLYL